MRAASAPQTWHYSCGLVVLPSSLLSPLTVEASPWRAGRVGPPWPRRTVPRQPAAAALASSSLAFSAFITLRSAEMRSIASAVLRAVSSIT